MDRKTQLELLRWPGVISVSQDARRIRRGAQTDEPCVTVRVVKKLPLEQVRIGQVIPMSIDGKRTDVVEHPSPIRALSIIAPQETTARMRPAPGGCSIGHYQITAGTLGCVVTDRSTGENVILSNNHVLAASNTGQIGDAILQPGAYDGGQVGQDTIATLLRFVAVNFGSGLPSDCPIAGRIARMLNAIASLLGSSTRLQAIRPQAGGNLVDAALAKPLYASDVSDEILSIGHVSGIAEVAVGDVVRKHGRTTDYTTGTVLETGVAANVQYGAGQIAVFEDQVMAGPMSAGGDSGSLIVDASNRAVGLLFAGSDQITLFNRAANVTSLLDIEI